MTTISEYSDNLYGNINEILKAQMLSKLDPILKQKLDAVKGDITFDYAKNTFEVTAGDEALEKEIIDDLKSKR